jgi:hypothetical protein
MRGVGSRINLLRVNCAARDPLYLFRVFSIFLFPSILNLIRFKLYRFENCVEHKNCVFFIHFACLFFVLLFFSSWYMPLLVFNQNMHKITAEVQYCSLC